MWNILWFHFKVFKTSFSFHDLGVILGYNHVRFYVILIRCLVLIISIWVDQKWGQQEVLHLVCFYIHISFFFIFFKVILLCVWCSMFVFGCHAINQWTNYYRDDFIMHTIILIRLLKATNNYVIWKSIPIIYILFSR